MDADHMSAIGLASAQESEISRLQGDLTRAEALLADAGIEFERTPNRAMPWLLTKRPGMSVNPKPQAVASTAAEAR